ncbi:helix-turn-helix transcriptional regulator [Brachybacterium kimchii]|uniref:Helix-turn-helix domain-containing protein n=1 Tax=Brachybacterium kimchii TaxID=2942909 RepID=A0ABY4N861_9MICO|nr:helix-turn-helix domain-containing protein [Brachybacterium kimchii]UQN29585.1 helix-turn-helix domain-containing protein [Brachybacterium kimchii]
MSLSTPAHPVVGDRLLTEQEAASMLGLKPATLRTWRSTGHTPQPRHVKVSARAVRYRLSDVQAHIADLSDGSEVAA